LALADTVAEPNKFKLGATPKVIVCAGSCATNKLCVACAAGANVSLPDWFAAMMQVPTVKALTNPELALTLQTVGVVVP